MAHIKNIIALISSSLSILIFTNCSHWRVQKEIECLQESKINIPADMSVVQNGQLLSSTYCETNNVKLIAYYTTDGCTSCKISHLIDMEELFAVDSLKRFIPIVIFAPDSSQYQYVISLLKQNSFEFPVYIDRTNEMRRKNTHLPSDSHYHTFLLDRNNRVVLVGNPLANDEMWALFKSTLDNMLAHDGEYVPE